MMAPTGVENGASSSTLLDEVSKPPEGIVLPPKDIRAIVEKTAGYVARNGAVFEDRIREKEKHNPKFSFLSPNDAYAAFYQWRLREVKEGRGTAVSAGRTGETAAPEPEKPKGPPPPPEFHFSARMPNISAQDLEVVKLTALFVARRGKSFMTALSQRESRNFQFDFLRPQHTLYQFFTRLVDQYTELLQGAAPDGSNSEKERLAEIQLNISNRYHMLERAKKRAEWVKWQEKQKQQKDEEEEKERIAYAQIDWHDFVVVETVVFTEADDQAELPPPTSLNDLQSASLEQKAKMSLQPSNMRIEEAMPTSDVGYQYNDPHASIPEQVHQTLPFHATQAPTATFSPQYSGQAPATMVGGPSGSANDDEERAIRERTEARDRAQAAQAAARGGQAPMRIRSDYVPRAQAKRQTVPMALCPNCKQEFPVDELAEHMRIELLDPRWKEQRAKAESRFATTNLSTADVANNLKRLASQRSDVFDASLNAQQSNEEEQRRKRVAMAGYDGSLDNVRDGQHLSLEEQIRQIHQKAKQ